jgi:hypothetical protein
VVELDGRDCLHGGCHGVQAQLAWGWFQVVDLDHFGLDVDHHGAIGGLVALVQVAGIHEGGGRAQGHAEPIVDVPELQPGTDRLELLHQQFVAEMGPFVDLVQDPVRWPVRDEDVHLVRNLRPDGGERITTLRQVEGPVAEPGLPRRAPEGDALDLHAGILQVGDGSRADSP